MILIVCVDNNGGMMFNDRRQSHDTVLKERVLNITKNSTLLMNKYTAKMFDNQPNISIEENFLAIAAKGEYVFAENVDAAPYESKIEKIILYKWNRDYPYDLKFSVDIEKWHLVGTCDFKGKSHEKITEEIYERGC